MTSNFCGRVTTRANARGHGLLDRLQHLENEMQQMERRLAKIEDRDLKAGVRNLEIIFTGMAKLEGSAATRQGSVAAHEGDALGDAVLFSKDPSLSPRIYCELYGLTYEQVLKFCRSHLQVLNDAETDWIQMTTHRPTMEDSMVCSTRMLQLLLREETFQRNSDRPFKDSCINSRRIGFNCRTKTLIPHLGWHISISGG